MKISALAGAVLVLTAVSARSASPDIPIKTGLWEIEWHTNWAMFVVRHDGQPPEERARVSEQALEHALYKRACVTDSGAKRPETVVLTTDSCKLERASDSVAKLDGICSGRKDGITELHITITSKSPKTAVIGVKATLDPTAGYPVIETYDMRWISADCGDLPPGTTRPVRPNR